MQNVLIVEDDDTQRMELCKNLKEQYPNWNICDADSYEVALDLLTRSIEEQNHFSLFLLDIQLTTSPDDYSGFTLAEKIRSYSFHYQTPILFLTSITEKIQFALTNYHCYNYIAKPYTASDVIFQIQQMLLTGFLGEHTISLIDTNQIKHRITLQEIRYIEMRSHAMVFYTIWGNITTRSFTSETLTEQLDYHFVQCHRKYYVNLNHVTKYDKSCRILYLEQQEVAVGRTYKIELEEKLTHYHLQ